MSTMLSQRHFLQAPWVSRPQRETPYPAAIGLGLEQPKVLVRGDIRLGVTESEAALHPIIGRYSVELADMQESLHILWLAEGQVLCRQARTIDIAFDVRGARAGETRTFLVAVQVTESGVQGRVVQCGVFVQIFVKEALSCMTA